MTRKAINLVMLILLLSIGIIGCGGEESGDSGIAGQYVNQHNSKERLSLMSDGTYTLEENGGKIEGEWRLKENILLLSWRGVTVEAKVGLGKIIDNEDKVWIAQTDSQTADSGDNQTGATTPTPHGTTTQYAAPIANAGSDQNVETGSVVTLDGTASTGGGRSLTYSWAFVSKPTGSQAKLSDATAAKPQFTADTDGKYTLSLSVSYDKSYSTKDAVVIIAKNSAPVATAGPDQNVATGSTVTLDGTASSGEGKSLTYSWVFVSKPTGSQAKLSDATAAKPLFTADMDGKYIISLTVSNGKSYSPEDTVMIISPVISLLEHRVIDAEYSKQLDKIVMIASTPNQLYIYDPKTQEEVKVELSLTPNCVSISPDGMYAAVGHNAWISYVNLSSATLEKTLAVAADAIDIVLAGNGYVYVFPRRDQWASIYCVNLSTGQETKGNATIYAGTLARLHPDGKSIYGANNGLSPSDIEKYSIEGGTAKGLYDSPYHGDYAMGGNLWISEDGQRIFVRAGNVFRSSTLKTEDMIYNGSFEGVNSIQHLSHSASANIVALIPGTNTYSKDSTVNDSQVRVYDYNYLGLKNILDLPQFTFDKDLFAAHGRFIFFNRDGTKFFVVAQADSTSKALLDYGIVSYSYVR